MDFDKELFFDLVDRDRANLAQNERLSYPYKHLIHAPYDLNDTTPITSLSYFIGCHFLQPTRQLDLTIRADFSLKTPLSSANMNLKTRILNTKDSVFLHIRRGDFLKTSFINLCEGKYYDGAIRFIKSHLSKPKIFIFSNDILWCKKEFLKILSAECKEGVEFEFIANNGEDSAAHEMELMRSCQNAIIANSSFSWWAGYLISNPQKIVVMPNKITKNHAPKTSENNATVLVDSLTGEVVKA